jgi:hypothetical protein
LPKSYERLLPTLLCLLSPRLSAILTTSANDFAFIFVMAWLRWIAIVISLIGGATNFHRIRASSKGACLKAVSQLNGNSQQITETRPISFRRGGFGAGVLRDLLFTKDLP